MSPNNDLKIVFGSMTFGKPNTLGARLRTAEGAANIIDIFQQHGHQEVDSARVYGNGSTDEIIAQLDWQKRGLTMAIKLYPTRGGPLDAGGAYDHEPAEIRRGLLDSLKALDTKHIGMFYLHGPDRKHSFEDTLREVNNLHKEGYFDRFGISNYQS